MSKITKEEKEEKKEIILILEKYHFSVIDTLIVFALGDSYEIEHLRMAKQIIFTG